MAFSLRGVRVPHKKNTINKPVAHMPTPARVTIPMSMHIGAPATPIVKVGDLVKVGTKIGEAGGNISSHVFSSVSGKVTAIRDFVLSNGTTTPAVVIESDGEMSVDEAVVPPQISTKEDLVEAIKASGIVGLGGAGFPTHVKLNVDPERIKHLIINCAECEPYITSDTYTMMERSNDIICALNALKQYLGIKHIIFGVESNNKLAFSAMMNVMMATMQGCTVDLKSLPARYPQGGEKVLIYSTTGLSVPTGKLPIDVGCIVLNCTTLASIGEYLMTGMPLVKKCVTVAGGAVADPQNVIAPIGASMEDVFAFCGGFNQEPAKLIYGGPMMGIAVPGPDAPIIKNTNAILALTAKEAKLPKTTACIRCGSCTNACPFGLTPAAIAKAFANKDAEELEKLSLNTCMECGCCSFMCPANRPLVQTHKLAKVFLKEEKAKEAASHE